MFGTKIKSEKWIWNLGIKNHRIPDLGSGIVRLSVQDYSQDLHGNFAQADILHRSFSHVGYVGCSCSVNMISFTVNSRVCLTSMSDVICSTILPDYLFISMSTGWSPVRGAFPIIWNLSIHVDGVKYSINGVLSLSSLQTFKSWTLAT